MAKVLFVCMGNICRSPAAQGVFQSLVERAGLRDAIKVESAGTIDYHAGDLPDERMRRAASARGVHLVSRARQVRLSDFDHFDYILAADLRNLKHLQGMASPERASRVRLIMEFARQPDALREVPDPYYGGPEGFEQVLDMLEDACAGLLETIRQERGL